MTAIPTRNLFFTSAAVATAAFFLAPADRAVAASSDACEGGGFTVTQLSDGGSVGQGESTIPASNVPQVFFIDGKYVEFFVVASTFGIRNYVFTGAANPADMTGGLRTPVWAEKTPDHRGLVLTGDISVDIDDEEIALIRSGTGGLTMKIQAKDCAQGGIFQMEPERGDHSATRITHVLTPNTFYFDNPNFRAREGDTVPFKDTTIVVPARVNIANDTSRRFVARDSAQVADRVSEPSCNNQIRKRDGTFATVLHCGGVTRWDVASGGRMGFVTGEDSVEVAPPPTDCIQNCQAQNRVRGRAVVLGHPFPVPAASRLQPRSPF